jgi:hypothetical protein
MQVATQTPETVMIEQKMNFRRTGDRIAAHPLGGE